MSAGQIVLLVVAILGVQALLVIVLLRWGRRRLARVVAELGQQLASGGEQIRRSPELASYRGGSGGHSRVKGTGAIALTDRRIVFRKLTGPTIEIPAEDIAGVRQDKWFRRSYRSGRMHVIVETTAGDEVGFIVREPDAWVEALSPRKPDRPTAT